MIAASGESAVTGEAARTADDGAAQAATGWSGRPRRTRWTGRTRWTPIVAGVVTTGVAVSGGTASLSGDEVATYSAAVARPLSGLLVLVQHVDGHFLPYYLLIHLWSFLGEAEWWLRLPSALAAGVAAGFLADLGRRLAGPRAGIVAAALFAVLPSVSFHGANARPYAFAAAAAVVSAWALHRVAESPTWGRAGGYAAAVALLGCTHLFSVLVLPAQFLAALLALPGRTAWTRVVPAMAAGCVPVVVLGLVGWGERAAISWIQPHGPEVLLKVPKHVAGSDLAGPVLFALAVAGVVILLRASVLWGVLVGGWLVLPPLLLLVVDALVTPAYVDRYVFVAAPALALSAGVALASVRPAALPAALVAVPSVLAVAALGLPAQADYRRQNGHYEDFPGAVEVIRAELRPGDAVVYGQSRLRTGFRYYGRDGLPDDVLLAGPGPAFEYAEKPGLADALAGRRRVWVVWRGTKQAGLEGTKIRRVAAVRAAGYRLSTAWHSAELPGLTVALFERGRRGN
ncbi:glycosyltransferase family 39 protein [Microbispora sp. H10949]|uniref:glycosyltransferase family 39 protein n=1 Tax=Microbispora sp. H10949 TaxID=2729111 RepID=UPI001603B36A|nr:glycosyltransferase family 39 protein [Microbispora sp. H10949]